jgi:LCP family protein required for cell wall assembly
VEQNVLLVGLDSRTDAQGNPLPAAVLAQLHAGSNEDGGDNTDTIIVVHIPAGAGEITAISIPRDSYVLVADGFGDHKINSAYAYAKNAATGPLREQGLGGADLDRTAARAGARTLIGTVEGLTGVRITHYVAMNLVGFYRLSQAVGGVPVCLSAPAHDDLTGLDLSSGWHDVQGAQALAFVRQRHGLPGGDLDRIRRQQAFLASLAHRVFASNILTDPEAVDRLTGSLSTSLTVDEGFEVLVMARQLQRLGAGQLNFTTIPTGSLAMPTTDGTAVEVDPAQVRASISHLDPNLAADTAPGSAAPVPSPGRGTGPSRPASLSGTTSLPSMPVIVGEQSSCTN